MNKAKIIVDLGYGDAGKGTIVDALTRQSENTLIVRYNGGPQCAHNVVLPNKIHHIFAQFGSGMLVPGTTTHLSRFMLINPITMLNETEGLTRHGCNDALSKTTIEETALIITPFHQIVNKLKEISRGTNCHGSCGMGVGEAVSDSLSMNNSLRIYELKDKRSCLKKLKMIQEQKKDEILQDYFKNIIDNSDDVSEELDMLQNTNMPEIIYDMYKEFIDKVILVDSDYLSKEMKKHSQIIFEGAQGILLDEWYGFHPYTTWTNTTTQNAKELLEDFDGEIETIGVTRTYSTRHGNGPFVSEQKLDKVEEVFNINNKWQHNFRVGPLDFVALRYALKVNGKIDSLAVTHLDYAWRTDPYICNRYVYLKENTEEKNKFFEFDKFDPLVSSDLISDIKLPPVQNLTYQEGLTKALFSCKPSLLHTKGDYLEIIETLLGIKASIISYGQTFLHKKVLKW